MRERKTIAGCLGREGRPVNDPAAGSGRTPRPADSVAGGEGAGRSALADLAQRGADALLGQSGLLLLAALLPFEALHRGQKPGCLRLAIYHGHGSFRKGPAGSRSRCTSSGPPGRTIPVFPAGRPRRLRPCVAPPAFDRPFSSIP